MLGQRSGGHLGRWAREAIGLGGVLGVVKELFDQGGEVGLGGGVDVVAASALGADQAGQAQSGQVVADQRDCRAGELGECADVVVVLAQQP